MQDLWAVIFGTAVGFTVAGLLASLYDIVTARRLTFAMPGKASTPELMMGIFLRVAAGPFLLVRGAYDALREGSANPLVVAAIVAVACMWGCLSGVIVVDLFGGFAPDAAAAR